MSRHPFLAAAAVFLLTTTLMGSVGVWVAGKLGEATNSGIVGICGPFGPAAGLIGLVLLVSFFTSVTAGIYLARRSYRYLSRNRDEN